MRIGVYARLSTGVGGVYQYALTILAALESLARTKVHANEFILITNEPDHPVAARLRLNGWTIVQMPVWAENVAGLGSVRRFVRRVLGDELVWRAYSRLRPLDLDDASTRPHARDYIASLAVDMMLYTSPTPIAFWAGVPYLMAIHDLQHRINPQFPEVGANGQWEGREQLYRSGARKALMLLAESEVGREDILRFYGPFGVREDVVRVLPYVAPPYLHKADPEEVEAVGLKYALPPSYLFYPAQFWPHKNHLRIIEALGVNKAVGLRTPIVLSGGHSDRLRNAVYKQVGVRARQLGVEEEIVNIGYIPDSDMPALYTGAKALVMPTFFGPSNIPFMEAWQCDCPVITSDIRGIREQVGDAGVLVDPQSPQALADAIRRVWTDPELRELLALNGRRMLARHTVADFEAQLASILDEAQDRLAALTATSRS